MSAHPSQPRVSTALVVAGFVLAVIFPLVGLIIGIVVLTKGAKGQGWGIIALAVAVMVFFLLIQLG
jgi:hypothetical protein